MGWAAPLTDTGRGKIYKREAGGDRRGEEVSGGRFREGTMGRGSLRMRVFTIYSRGGILNINICLATSHLYRRRRDEKSLWGKEGKSACAREISLKSWRMTFKMLFATDTKEDSVIRKQGLFFPCF